jgi:hypothetical protein
LLRKWRLNAAVIRRRKGRHCTNSNETTFITGGIKKTASEYWVHVQKELISDLKHFFLLKR